MTTYYNHAYTLAFEVISTNPDGATKEEWVEYLRKRLMFLDSDPGEIEEAWGTDVPFDTYKMTEQDVKQWHEERSLPLPSSP